jgi:hypothetical protein
MDNRINHSRLASFNLHRPYSSIHAKDWPAQELNSTLEARCDKPLKGYHHISWKEAWVAENERERARLFACNEIPTAGPIELFAANVARELPKLKARAFRYFTWMSVKRRATRSTSRTQAQVDNENYYIVKLEGETRLPVSSSMKQGPLLAIETSNDRQQISIEEAEPTKAKADRVQPQVDP